MGIGLEAMVALRLTRHARSEVDSFRTHAVAQPAVLACYHMAGVNDFLLHVAVRDAGHLREFILDAFTTRPEVAHIETAIIFEAVRNPQVPCYV